MKTIYKRISFTLPLILAAFTLLPCASNAQTQVQIGSGTASNAVDEYPTPYGGYNGSTRSQFLVLASELQAAGLTPGSIAQVGFRVAGQAGTPLVDFTISLGLTSASELSGTFEGGMQVGLGPINFVPATGWNYHTLATPIYWDGVKNLVIQTCFNNNSPAVNSQVYYATTTFNASTYKSANASNQCAVGTGATVAKRRPLISITWAPPGQLGVGTAVNTTTSYPAPYGNYYWGAKHQFLYTADELKGAGLKECVIRGLGWNVLNSVAVPLQGFTIKIGTTTQTTLSAFVPDHSFTTVYGPTTYTDYAGWNYHEFPTPYNWNGTSNLIVQVCFNNTSYIYNAGTPYATLPVSRTVYYYYDGAGVCGNPSGTVTTFRTNIRFTYSNIFDKDAQVSKILSPAVNDCSKSEHPLKVLVYNAGKQGLSNIVVKATLKGDTSAYSYTDTLKYLLPSFKSDTVSFGTFNSALSPTWKITAWTEHPEEMQNENDTAKRTSNIKLTPHAQWVYNSTGLNVNFLAQFPGADIYFWDFGDGNISVTQNPSHSYATAGTYKVRLIVSNSCGEDTLEKNVKVPSTGMATTLSGNLNLKPNPARSVVEVSGWGTSFQPKVVRVFSQDGRQWGVWELDMNSSSPLGDTPDPKAKLTYSDAERIRLNVESLPQGIFVIQIQDNGGQNSVSTLFRKE